MEVVRLYFDHHRRRSHATRDSAPGIGAVDTPPPLIRASSVTDLASLATRVCAIVEARAAVCDSTP